MLYLPYVTPALPFANMLSYVIPALPFANMLPYVIPALPSCKYVVLCYTCTCALHLHCLL